MSYACANERNLVLNGSPYKWVLSEAFSNQSIPETKVCESGLLFKKPIKFTELPTPKFRKKRTKRGFSIWYKKSFWYNGLWTNEWKSMIGKFTYEEAKIELSKIELLPENKNINFEIREIT